LSRFGIVDAVVDYNNFSKRKEEIVDCVVKNLNSDKRRIVDEIFK